MAQVAAGPTGAKAARRPPLASPAASAHPGKRPRPLEGPWKGRAGQGEGRGGGWATDFPSPAGRATWTSPAPLSAAGDSQRPPRNPGTASTRRRSTAGGARSGPGIRGWERNAVRKEAGQSLLAALDPRSSGSALRPLPYSGAQRSEEAPGVKVFPRPGRPAFPRRSGWKKGPAAGQGLA